MHPATGYSITRSLREAPALAADIQAILARGLPLGATAEATWHALWTPEKRRQVPFCGDEMCSHPPCRLCVAAVKRVVIHVHTKGIWDASRLKIPI